MRSITGENVGPFFESGRLRGTPGADGYQEPEDDRRRCQECLKWFAADELAVICGAEVCTECEDAKVKNQPPDLTAGEFNRE